MGRRASSHQSRVGHAHGQVLRPKELQPLVFLWCFLAPGTGQSAANWHLVDNELHAER